MLQQHKSRTFKFKKTCETSIAAFGVYCLSRRLMGNAVCREEGVEGELGEQWGAGASSVRSQQQKQTGVLESTNAMAYFHINFSSCL